MRPQGPWFGSRRFFVVLFSLFFLVCAMYLNTSVNVGTMVIEVSSQQSRRHFYILTECCYRCCCFVCCYVAVAAAAVLLLLVTVRRRVPDGQVCCWFVESDPSVFFLFIQTRVIFYVSFGSTVSHLRPRFAYILGNYRHARSQGGRQPAAAKLPMWFYFRRNIYRSNVVLSYDTWYMYKHCRPPTTLV